MYGACTVNIRRAFDLLKVETEAFWELTVGKQTGGGDVFRTVVFFWVVDLFGN